MTKLEELIEKLCPNGVEYKTLTELFDTKNGYTPSKSKEEYWTNGTVPWFRMEDIRENGNILSKAIQYVSESAIKGSLFPADSIIVATSATIGQHALIKVPSLANQRFTYLVLKDEFKEQIDIMFIYYCCFKLDEYCKECLNQGNFASVDMKKFLKFKFPVPPLEVQREIVRILDNFTFLTTELAAELAARQKQYEYYRDLLLTFKSNESTILNERTNELEINAPVRWMKLGDIGIDFYRGNGIKRNEVTNDGIPCVRYGEIYTSYEIAFTDCISHTDVSYITNPKYFEHGDILFAITGESIEDIAKSIAYLGSDKCLAGGDIVVMKHNQNPRYLSYALSTLDAIKQKGKGKIKSKVVHASVPSIKEIEIPLPSLEEQEKIANILDNYRFLCNDISNGLPAEIEARQKQYEYYRDKLLTFKELKKEA